MRIIFISFICLLSLHSAKADDALNSNYIKEQCQFYSERVSKATKEARLESEVLDAKRYCEALKQPLDVQNLVVSVDDCIHFSGEFNGENTHEDTINMTKAHDSCVTMQEQYADVIFKYAHNPEILNLIKEIDQYYFAAFGDNIKYNKK